MRCSSLYSNRWFSSNRRKALRSGSVAASAARNDDERPPRGLMLSRVETDPMGEMERAWSQPMMRRVGGAFSCFYGVRMGGPWMGMSRGGRSDMAIVAMHVNDGGVCGEIDLGGGNGSLIGSGRPPA